MTWLLIVFVCFGHTNAKCTPAIKNYKTREQCAESLVYQSQKSFWSDETITKVRSNAVCIPISGEAFGGTQ